MRSRALLLAPLLAAACVYDNGPFGADGFPEVEGRWSVEARALSSTCGSVSDEPFQARVVQSRDLIQIAVDVAGFGEVRWDGRVDRDGEFRAFQRTVYTEDELRDESELDGEFSHSGGDLVATETERITDLRTGRACTIVWRWNGDRRGF